MPIWHGSAEGLRELPECPVAKSDKESILPEPQDGERGLRTLFFMPIWGPESKGKEGESLLNWHLKVLESMR